MRSKILLLIALLALAFVPALPILPPPPIQKGLAQLNWSHNEDRATIGVGQWYAWGMGACGSDYTHCTPMNRNWDTVVQTFCPPRELLGNEPTNLEPAGHPISPTLAVSVTRSIEQLCPNTALVIGNVHLNNQYTVAGNFDHTAAVEEAYQWLRDYLSIYALRAGHPLTHTIGVHCYSQYATECLGRLTALRNLQFNGSFWLTEAGIFGEAPYINSGTELGKFLTGLPLVLPNRLLRLYLWTNRTDPSCCSGWPFELVNTDGTLTPMGVVYYNWSPPVVSQIWVPVLNPGPKAYP